MGGIAGIIHYRGDAPDRGLVARLSSDLAHRGPHGGWDFCEGPAVMCERPRLVGDEQLPQPTITDQTVLLLDGRLYDSDPAGIVEAWNTRGPDCVADIDGEFALAAWDRRQQVLWLARDAHGIRPLHTAMVAWKFAFASEISPLLALPWVSRTLATDHIAEYLSFRYVHAPRTLFRDVRAVPPGHIMRVDASGVRLDRWWRPRWAPPGTQVPDERQTVERVDSTLRRAVDRRVADVLPVGVLLSGGLDSSAILFHACDRAGPRPLSFTVAISDDPADESGYASRVAKMMESEHHVVVVESHRIIDLVEACTRHMGQPMPSAAAVLQYLLYHEVRTRTPVVLSGDGGDEVLGGRGMEFIAARMRTARAVGRLPGPLRQATRALAERAGVGDLAATAAHFGRDRNIGGSRVFHSSERVDLFRDPGMVRPGIRRVVLEPFYQEVDSDPINAILHVWQRGWLPEDSLARSDRMAAFAGVEVRYPLLDKRLVALTEELPGAAKVARHRFGFHTKWPLRRAMSDRIPTPFLNRPKRFLPNPLDRWLRTSGREFLRERVDTFVLDDSGLFDVATVRRLEREHLEGAHNHGLKLWTLCLFQTWRQIFAP